MMALIGMIPILGQVATSFITGHYNAQVSILTARLGGARDVAVEMLRSEATNRNSDYLRLGTIAGNKLLTYMLIAGAIPIFAFEWKVVIYDTMLGLGSTEPVKGQVAEWMNIIVYCLFGSGTALGVGQLAVNAINRVK